MDRNSKFLKFLLVIFAFATFISCFKNKKSEDDNIYDSDTKYLSLSKAEGKYFFVPKKYDYIDEYKIFDLKKGDTIFLEIKKDSTFAFNHFYYNKQYEKIQMSSIENYSGKVKTSNDTTDKDKIKIPFLIFYIPNMFY